jgi:hypothetical protein
MRPEAGISLVTPVRDRLDHLLATLPNWCGHDLVAEVVICDFGSDPPVSEDILDVSAKIKLVVAGEAEPWNKGLAQNIGILASRHGIILKSDCDVFYENLDAYLEKVVKGGFVSGYLPFDGVKFDMTKAGCAGQVMFRKSDWRAIGGYHEFMHGWGFDDQDIYNRLEDAGVAHYFFNLDDIRDIPHSDAIRGGARLVDDVRLSLPDRLRRSKFFQNSRNKILAGLIPWQASLGRKRVLRKTGASTYRCVLEPRSALETQSQLAAAFLASRFWLNSGELESGFYKSVIGEVEAGFYKSIIDHGLVGYAANQLALELWSVPER